MRERDEVARMQAPEAALQRMQMLERLQEVYRQQGRRGVPPWLLSLQQIYQADRSEENEPMKLTIKPRNQ